MGGGFLFSGVLKIYPETRKSSPTTRNTRSKKNGFPKVIWTQENPRKGQPSAIQHPLCPKAAGDSAERDRQPRRPRGETGGLGKAGGKQACARKPTFQEQLAHAGLRNDPQSLDPQRTEPKPAVAVELPRKVAGCKLAHALG